MLPMKDRAELKRDEFSLPLELCWLAALTAVLESTIRGIKFNKREKI